MAIPPEQSADLVKAALASGNKIEAIKIFRETTGVGLAEAKAAIEKISAEQAPPPRPAAGTISPAVVEALRRGERISAIRQHRLDTGAGLKEAKDAVEAAVRELGLENVPAAKGGCLATILVIAASSLFLVIALVLFRQ